MERFKFSKNRYLVKYCPCGKNNKDGKFAPYEGYTKHGYCHSCCKPFFPEDGTIVESFDMKNNKKNQKPPYYFSPELVEKTELGIHQNNLVQYIRTIFPDNKVNEANKKYKIGTWERGKTVYWEIDQNGIIHYGKVMGYDKKTGKRAFRKDGKPDINSMRCCLKLGDYKNSHCLFGLHLINENTKKVALVEAPKTAYVMSMPMPEYVWVATGDKGGFKADFLESIKHCEIVAFPDKGAYSDWSEKAKKLNKLGFNIRVQGWLEDMDYPDNTDLADIYIDLILKSTSKSWQPKNDSEFSEGSLEVYRMFQDLKIKRLEITKDESYKAMQYYIDNDTDTYRL